MFRFDFAAVFRANSSPVPLHWVARPWGARLHSPCPKVCTEICGHEPDQSRAYCSTLQVKQLKCEAVLMSNFSSKFKVDYCSWFLTLTRKWNWDWTEHIGFRIEWPFYAECGVKSIFNIFLPFFINEFQCSSLTFADNTLLCITEVVHSQQFENV